MDDKEREERERLSSSSVSFWSGLSALAGETELVSQPRTLVPAGVDGL